MSPRSALAICALCLLVLARTHAQTPQPRAPSANGRAQQAFTVEQLLDRSSAYVEDLVTKFSRVVAEEQYTQEYLMATPQGSRVPRSCSAPLEPSRVSSPHSSWTSGSERTCPSR